MEKEKFYELDSSTIEEFNEVFNTKAFPRTINLEFVGSSSQKQMIKISKLPEWYTALHDKELLITINEDIIDAFDEESQIILIEQELDKIEINIESGKMRLVRPDLTTFSSLINKYGVEKVGRANKVEELFSEQRADADEFAL